MPVIMMSPISPVEDGGEMFQRTKTHSFFQARSSTGRPLSDAADETDFEDDSGDEEYSPQDSYGSNDSRRRSQTTISSIDEVPTPSSTQGRPPFDLRSKSVEGPKGPHLFRASISSAEVAFDYALQMSPLLPKQPPIRTETAFSEETVTPITRQRELDFSIDSALNQTVANDLENENWIRSWSSEEVTDWMYSCGIDASVIQCFEIHDVNGAVILDLAFEDLKELDIQSFGKRHQLWNAICDLRGLERSVTPAPTPFQDTSRPCTSNARRSPSRGRNAHQVSFDELTTPISPATGKKRRGRKVPKELDVVTPAESVSIVAIEQLLPKPHKCAKGERCAKWRKQQREIQQLQNENGIGRFPISPTKGGRIYVHGDPGNPITADNIVPNVRKQTEDFVRPQSEGFPSVVASSDLLGPGQIPEFALHADMLDQLDKRDPQDNVRQFLNFQLTHSPEESPSTPTEESFYHTRDPIVRSGSVPLFPQQHYQPYVSTNYTYPVPTAPREELRNLPRLDIPRSASAAPNFNNFTSVDPITALSICRSATASPEQMSSLGQVYRFGTPASDMDVPVTAIPLGPLSRDNSQSVPPNMQFNQPSSALSRSHSRAADWRRPSMALPAVKEGEVFSSVSQTNSGSSRPSISSRTSSGSSTDTRCSTSSVGEKIPDPAHHSPQTQHFGYGAECSHAGWMKKRKTKLLRHEWTEQHCRLKGTQLALHANARLSSAATQTIDVDNYAVACSSVANGSKLAAAMKALNISSDKAQKDATSDATAFAFQLIPARDRKTAPNASAAGSASFKTHHFAVKTKDDRIDWMRELMLAKALQQKGKGYSVEINGVVHE